MCVVCGSFGKGAEGRLLACSQCGQCYHPYCVSIKVSDLKLFRFLHIGSSFDIIRKVISFLNISWKM